MWPRTRRNSHRVAKRKWSAFSKHWWRKLLPHFCRPISFAMTSGRAQLGQGALPKLRESPLLPDLIHSPSRALRRASQKFINKRHPSFPPDPHIARPEYKRTVRVTGSCFQRQFLSPAMASRQITLHKPHKVPPSVRGWVCGVCVWKHGDSGRADALLRGPTSEEPEGVFVGPRFSAARSRK